jgi:predicted nucleic acid-binding protein
MADQEFRGAKADRRLFSHPVSRHVPHPLDVEIAQVRRRYVRETIVTTSRSEEALQDLNDRPLNRYPHDILMSRVWELQAILAAYDAVYVALAELLDAPLVICARKIAQASGHRTAIEAIWRETREQSRVAGKDETTSLCIEAVEMSGNVPSAGQVTIVADTLFQITIWNLMTDENWQARFEEASESREEKLYPTHFGPRHQPVKFLDFPLPG